MDNFSNFSQQKTNPFESAGESYEFNFESEDSDFMPEMKDSEYRLNDYDSNLLSEGAYKNLDNEILKLEYKIGRMEKKIKALDSQLEMTNALGDIKKSEFLLSKKAQCESELETLYRLYRSQSLPSDLSERIINLFLFVPRKMVELIGIIRRKMNSSIVSRVVKGKSKSNFQNALIALENINKNVDELVSLRTPYGESAERYEQLQEYLNKANRIQSQISKFTSRQK